MNFFNYSERQIIGILIIIFIIEILSILPRCYFDHRDNKLASKILTSNYLFTTNSEGSHLGDNNSTKTNYRKTIKKLDSIPNKKHTLKIYPDNKNTNSSLNAAKINSTNNKLPQYNKSILHLAEGNINIKSQNRKWRLSPKYKLQLEMNSSDTTDLKKIYGIGSWYSRKIVRYRERLGGYFAVSQLKEIRMREGAYEKMSPHLFVDTTLIKKINLDTIGFSNLLRHPYFDYYMVKKVFDLRKSNKNITSRDLIDERIITQTQLKKIRHYLNK